MKPIARIDRSPHGAERLRALVASSSLGAGLIHVAVVAEHLQEGWILGSFFILAGAFQIAWAVPTAVGRRSLVDAIGAVANGAIAALWLVSRTTGIPMGPHAWEPEPAAILDVTATALELAIVVGSLVLIRRRATRRGGIRTQGIPAASEARSHGR